jgi:hypothetical protein
MKITLPGKAGEESAPSGFPQAIPANPQRYTHDDLKCHL